MLRLRNRLKDFLMSTLLAFGTTCTFAQEAADFLRKTRPLPPGSDTSRSNVRVYNLAPIVLLYRTEGRGKRGYQTMLSRGTWTA